MTTFQDGPARPAVLSLRRSPLFLRVVHGPRGWDALDQLDDEPRPNETVHVYRRVCKPRGHVTTHERGRGRRCYPLVEYTLHPNQPSAEVVRDTEKWQEWCVGEQQSLRDAGRPG